MGDTGVILVAAGRGKRMSSLTNKVFLELSGQPVIKYSLDVFEQMDEVEEIIIVAHPDDYDFVTDNIVNQYNYRKVRKVVNGGPERLDSVRNGLDCIDKGLNLVAVHDGARPLLSMNMTRRVIEAARASGAACPGVKAKDTLRMVDDDGFSHTLDRERTFLIQTPQVFKLSRFLEAMEKARADGFYATDDAALFEKYCGPVTIVEGNYSNLKLTTAEDMDFARGWLSGVSEMRIGIGYDVHRLVEGRELILGGVKIPFARGLLGHSDADVLIHAICDALLGAAGLRDIGHKFPDSDPVYAGISSLVLLHKTSAEVRALGYDINNIDAVVIAQRPRISPYIDEMRRCLAEVAGIDMSRINIKGTTTEGLGFAGRGEGISAQAAVLLVKGRRKTKFD